jgi:hypothetical protein
MDLGFWSFLHKDADPGRLLLRQRIPEVCIFRGCRLEGWYHNNANGLVVRRKQGVNLKAMRDFFLAPAAKNPEGQQTPVAILRTPSAISDFAFTYADGSPAPKVPQSAVLTAEELSELVQRIEAGEPPFGVIPNAAGEQDAWSLQAFIQPPEDVRAISVYSCDATALETSTIFGRSFSKPYRRERQITVPTPEDVANDRCLTLPPARRAALEAKTLSVVRYVSRFYDMDFEGLILEFIFDSQSRAVLHGCWASTFFGSEPRRKITSSGSHVNLSSSRSSPSIPRTFPVPSVVDSDADAFLSGEASPRQQGTDDESGGLGVTGLERGVEAELGIRSRMQLQPPPQISAEVVKECTLLLEIWAGDEFMGEAAILCDRNTSLQDQRFHLRTGEDSCLPTRVDERKSRAVVGKQERTVKLSMKWVDDGESTAFIRFGPVHSEGLNPDASLNLRLLLWMKQSSTGDFAPVWASKEIQHAANPAWDEVVDLTLPLITFVPKSPRPASARSSASIDASAPNAVGAAGAAVRQRRPLSARGRLESSSRSCSERGLHQTSSHSKSKSDVQIEFATTVAGVHEHVCGAELTSHWGMNDADGSMSTYVLACQVSQRLSSKGTNGYNRSALLTQLSAQLQQFHHVQLSWDEHWHAAKDTVDKAHAEMQCRDNEMDKIKTETKEIVQMHQAKLAQTCRDMCGSIDEQRLLEHEDSMAWARSQQRLNEQRAMADQLIEESRGLQSSMVKTQQKFDEVTRRFDHAREMADIGIPSVSTAPVTWDDKTYMPGQLGPRSAQDESGYVQPVRRSGQPTPGSVQSISAYGQPAPKSGQAGPGSASDEAGYVQPVPRSRQPGPGSAK